MATFPYIPLSTTAPEYCNSYASWYVGESKPEPLKASVTAFCPASIDTFSVKAPLLGDLTHIRLSHNAKGAHPDWLVEMVRVVHVDTKQEWVFFGHVWLHSGNANQVTLTPGWFPEGVCTMLRCACCAVPSHCVRKGVVALVQLGLDQLVHSDWVWSVQMVLEGFVCRVHASESGCSVSERLICPHIVH